MAFTTKSWFDRDSEYPNRRIFTPASGGTGESYFVDRDEGLVYEEGSPFDAESMNDLEDRIAVAYEPVQAHMDSRDNPHEVTPAQIGALPDDGTAVNAALLGGQPASYYAGAAELEGHLAAPNPHGLTAGDVGALAANATAADSARLNGQSASHYATAGALSTLNGTVSSLNGSVGSISSTLNTVKTTADAALPKSGGTVNGTVSVRQLTVSTGTTSLDSRIWNGDAGTLVLQSNSGTVNINNSTNGWGNIQCGTVYEYSSARFKDNVREIPDEAAKALLGARVVEYTYKPGSKGFDGGKTHRGFIAEELAGMDSSYVGWEDGLPTSVSKLDMIPAIVRLLQLQSAEIQSLKGKLNTLIAGGEQNAL